jgi:hypothetical protein
VVHTEEGYCNNMQFRRILRVETTSFYIIGLEIFVQKKKKIVLLSVKALTD